MTADIRAAAIDRISRLPWMDDEIKGEIKRRMDKKLVMLNAPEWILDHEKMDFFFATLEVNRSAPFIENFISAKRFNDIVEATTLIDSDNLDWLSFLRQPHSIFTSAENLVQYNAFALFPALFRAPYYHKSSQEFMKYSGIGIVIGNEFGRDFEGFSLRATNLSKIEGLEEKERCMRKYYRTLVYRGYKSPDVYMLGTADVAGLNWAYEAYRKSVQRPNDQVFSVLPYTQDQLFFINAAQLLCRPRDPTNKDYKADNEIRVLGMISQTKHAGKVFECPQGSAMYPLLTCGTL
ncbi:endothelin-converting enzyme 1-like [Lineus longissimus]